MPVATAVEKTLPDEALMERYRAGEPTAFAVLYERHQGAVYRYLRRATRDIAAAEELCQDVWLRFIAAQANYRGLAKVTTWLFTIAHHRLVDHFRSKGHSDIAECGQEALDATPAPDLGPEEWVARKEMATHLIAAIGSLPAMQGEAFLLQQEGGLTVEQIATMTGVSRETAKSRLRYALMKLRTALAEQKHGLNADA